MAALVSFEFEAERHDCWDDSTYLMGFNVCPENCQKAQLGIYDGYEHSLDESTVLKKFCGDKAHYKVRMHYCMNFLPLVVLHRAKNVLWAFTCEGGR